MEDSKENKNIKMEEKDLKNKNVASTPTSDKKDSIPLVENKSSDVTSKPAAAKPKKKEVVSNFKIADESMPGNFNPFERKTKFVQTKSNSPFEERIINIKRVIKVTKGGRQFSFSALVVVGDKKGRVGFATSKSKEIPDAIKKAVRISKKNLYRVKITGKEATVPHEAIGKKCSARVLLKPAKEGKGIVSSNVVRSVVELAGFRNIYSKNLGTNNPQNVIIATINALISMKTKEEFMKLRDKKK